MPYYNHVYVIAFDVKSRKLDASDVTAQMLRAALLKYVLNAPAEELKNACDGPYETEATEPNDKEKAHAQTNDH